MKVKGVNQQGPVSALAQLGPKLQNRFLLVSDHVPSPPQAAPRSRLYTCRWHHLYLRMCLSHQLCVYFSSSRAKFITSDLAAVVPEKETGRDVQAVSGRGGRGRAASCALVFLLNNRLGESGPNPWDQSTTRAGKHSIRHLAGKRFRDELIMLIRFPNNETGVTVNRARHLRPSTETLFLPRLHQCSAQ